MSKKHRKLGNYNVSSSGGGQPTAALSHEAEYRIIKSDLIKVVILNAIYLAVILLLYFENQKTRFLEYWFSRILHF